MKVLLLICCGLAISSTRTVDGSHRYIRDYDRPEGEHTDCRGARMELSNQMKEIKCMPRKSLVKLQPEPGYSFFPNIVSIDRCDGLCGENLSCMPLQTIIKPILVRRNYIRSKDLSCYRAYVEEHTRCKCKCNVMEEDCNKKQIYVPDDCACKCMNTDQQLACSLMKNMIWNSEECKCTCAMQEEECSTGLEWIPSLCRCSKVMDYDEN